MDEELHMEQARSYCKGHLFSYDARISTPPGLYMWPWLLSILTKVLSIPFLNSCICSVLFLRLICGCFAVLLWLEFKSWSRLSRRSISSTQLLFLWSHPILFFYYFFYYTDVPSLYFGLLCLRFSYKRSPVNAAIFATLATLHRQTSLMYHLVSCLILASQLFDCNAEMSPSSIVSFLWKLLANFIFNPIACFRLCWPHFVCFIGYGLWLVQRGTVAIGHAEHHRLIFHPTMVLYFLCYELLFYPPSVFLVLRFLKSLRDSSLYWQLMAMIFFLCVRYCIYLHPFLLSDRRHYTFLFVRCVFQKRKYLRYALIPFSLVATYSMEEKLRNLEILEQTYLKFLIAFPFIFIPLLELRYFVPNYIIIHLVCLVFTSTKLQGDFRKQKSKGERDVSHYTVNILDSDHLLFYRCLCNVCCYVVLLMVFYCFPLDHWKTDGLESRSLLSQLHLDCRKCALERMMP
ncbi:alpha-1,2-glucosyltransferase [Galdieria sulphuraria]|uniref:Dol-P-Glc:Glc(2)Man(9)GlcNAc(2)-PP-Dol alpha-1,2-glucosyltransferase n=1 Tax=Galdieria sulphuraria TaxID=130081 RepID=M2XWS7_GALSU|nr:alpha-1,2-glucosyltransferase [Galdieria sulphuraria]EME28083.1 alpha-1,2-glucosyltransferase [Galdieria sulphuraria]|eukprot:XP_005704603.1 alpha-1,2-glucosyltransferase [Galdieria sulphuraria]